MAKVLIVDDHPAIRMAVNMLLKQEEHHVLGEVDNGVDAIGINRLADGRLYISYESATHYRTVIYDHEKFMEYRLESLK